MQKIHETLFILHKCYRNVLTMWNAIQKNEQKVLISRYHFTYNLADYILLETVSFLDEYNDFFIPIKIDETDIKQKISAVRKIIKPITAVINKWKDLKKYRNNIIAHPWRSGNDFIHPKAQYYNIPRTKFEVQVLIHLIGYMVTIIEKEFQKELAESLFFIESLKEDIKPRLSLNETNTYIRNMAEKLDSLSLEVGKEYNIQIFFYE